MYVNVKLLEGLTQSLLYAVPQHLQAAIKVGDFVKVPLRSGKRIGIVESIVHKKPGVAFAIKPLVGIEKMPADEGYYSFVQKVAQYYQIDPCVLLCRMMQFCDQKESPDEIEEVGDIESVPKLDRALTGSQKQIYETLAPDLGAKKFVPALIHGVTGSGKSEVYKELIVAAIKRGKSVIFLLPEVTLAVQFGKIFRAAFGAHYPLYEFHSAVSVKEKKRLWAELLAGRPVVIIGVHMPVFLPISNLGLIIIDEEHDTGFAEKSHPKINSKEVALMRAAQYGCMIVLGSATPSIATLYTCKERGWQFFSITQRFQGAFPRITTVPLTTRDGRKNFWISKELEAALKRQLAAGKQSIIFLNRRGYSFFLQCKECAHIFECSNCSVSFTLHDGNLLLCHYCGVKKDAPVVCVCGAGCDTFLKKGIGTQQVVQILERLLPNARVDRADLDATINKKKWQETLRRFTAGELDILVGTKTITKGYHFPNVTLVGVLWGDLNLHFPVYNATETTLQQLIQVAGRAGRCAQESTVLVQTMIDHPVFSFTNEVDYLSFYESEIEKRRAVSFPPCVRFVELEFKYTDPLVLESEARSVARALKDLKAAHGLKVDILGPAKPPVAKVKNVHAIRIYLKAPVMDTLIRLYQTIDKSLLKSALFFTPNPLQ